MRLTTCRLEEVLVSPEKAGRDGVSGRDLSRLSGVPVSETDRGPPQETGFLPGLTILLLSWEDLVGPSGPQSCDNADRERDPHPLLPSTTTDTSFIFLPVSKFPFRYPESGCSN